MSQYDRIAPRWDGPPGPPPPLAPRAPLAEGARRPRVSVVMPTYKRPHYIGETVASVMRQTFTDFELLVRDDVALDNGTEAAVREAAGGDPRVRYHRNPKNLGMPGNVSSGVEETVGDYVVICHDHDLFHPEFLEALAGLLDRYPTALYAHCGLQMIDDQGRDTDVRYVGDWPELVHGSEWMPKLLKSFSCPVSAATMVRRSAHEQYGLYHPAFGFIADVEMWMRLATVGDVAYSARPLLLFRGREEGHAVTANSWPILASSFAIHRLYLPQHYEGIERVVRELALSARSDSAVLRELLYRLRHLQYVPFGKDAAALRRSAGLIGRLLALLAP